MAEPLVLINAFEVPAAEGEKFIAAWEQSRDYLRSQPGYVDTALHQAVTPTADFQFVNVGRWQSAQEFLAATQSPGFRQAATGWPIIGLIRACIGLCAPEDGRRSARCPTW